jgi:hypothetical protein
VNILLVSVGIGDASHCVHAWAVPGLSTAGHQAHLFDPYLATELYGWTGCQRLLLQTVAARQIDRILCFPPYDMIDPDTSAACKALGVPIIAFRYDDGIFVAGHRGPRLAQLLSESQTIGHLIGTTCDGALEEAGRLGLEGWERWPLPISPEPWPVGNGEKQYDVTFVGPAMLCAERPSPRAAFVLKLQAAGIDVRVWGHDWHQVPGLKATSIGPRLGMADMVTVIQQSRLCLALPGNYHEHPWPMIKFRNLEVAACGSVALQERHPDIDRQLTPFEEYWPYTDTDDAIAQIRTALADPERLATMGRQAAERIRQDHTWTALWPRFEDGLRDRGFPATPWQGQEPDPAAIAAVAIANLGLAHACEAKGQDPAAEGYFRSILKDCPDDRTAWAGLARLAERQQAPATQVVAAWQRAKGSGPSRSYNMEYGPSLGLPGLGARFYSDPTADAALFLFRTLGQQGDLIAAAAEAPVFAAHFHTALLSQARLWAQRGHGGAAAKLYDALLDMYPDHPDWRAEADRLSGRNS